MASGAYVSTRLVRTVSTSTDTLPSYLTSAHVPISDDELVSGEGSISSGVRAPSARATSSGSSLSESTQILLDSLPSVRPTAPHATPEGFRRQLVEGSDIGFGLGEETYHPPVTDDKVHNEMTRGEYDTEYRCVQFAFVFDNCPLSRKSSSLCTASVVATLSLWKQWHLPSLYKFTHMVQWQLQLAPFWLSISRYIPGLVNTSFH